MLKLMRLEFRKHRFRWFLTGTLLTNLFTIGLCVLILTVEKGEVEFQTAAGINFLMGTIIRATFIVFASVLISKLIIEEFRDKTIGVMFTYPISRKKLITAKLVLISSMTFAGMFLSNIFVVTVFNVIDHIWPIMEEQFPMNLWLQELIRILSFCAATAIASLVPLYIGMRNKSVPATIVSSILMVAVLCQYNEFFSLANIIYVPVAFAVAGALIAFAAVRQIDKADIA